MKKWAKQICTSELQIIVNGCKVHVQVPCNRKPLELQRAHGGLLL